MNKKNRKSDFSRIRTHTYSKTVYPKAMHIAYRIHRDAYWMRKTMNTDVISRVEFKYTLFCMVVEWRRERTHRARKIAIGKTSNNEIWSTIQNDTSSWKSCGKTILCEGNSFLIAHTRMYILKSVVFVYVYMFTRIEEEEEEACDAHTTKAIE